MEKLVRNCVAACRYGTSTDIHLTTVFNCSNKTEHVTKEPYFKVYAFMTDNHENKFVML